MGTGTGPIQANLNGRIFWDQARGKLVIKDENGTQRLLASAESIKLSQSGFNVETATDSQLIFSSEFNMFKIVDTNTTTIPSSGSSSSVRQIAHGLSGTPIVMAFGLILGNTVPFPILGINDTTGAIISYYTCYADNTNIYLRVAVPGGTVVNSTNVRYYIVQETAATS